MQFMLEQLTDACDLFDLGANVSVATDVCGGVQGKNELILKQPMLVYEGMPHVCSGSNCHSGH